MIIEPCCIQNQLPSLLEARHDVIFYSNGDWDIEKLMFSVACMVDGAAVEVFSLQRLDISLCRYLRRSLQRKWAKGIFIVTADDCSALVIKQLSGYADKVLYVHRQNLNTQLYVRYNAEAAVAVCGRMFLMDDAASQERGKFCMYHGLYGGHGRKFKELMEGIVPLFAVSQEVKGKTLSEVKQNFILRKYE